MHVKAKDTVVVLSGKARGERGTVLSVDRVKRRAIVERLNMVKKHSRANPKKGVQAGIVEREAPIDLSNLMLVCPTCGQPTRAAQQRAESGRRARRCRHESCQAPIDK